MKNITAILLFIFIATPAAAEVVDLSTMTCRQFLLSGKEGASTIVLWLDGLYGDKAKPVVDFDKLKPKAGKLGEFCAKNPDTALMKAAEGIMQNPK